MQNAICKEPTIDNKAMNRLQKAHSRVTKRMFFITVLIRETSLLSVPWAL